MLVSEAEGVGLQVHGSASLSVGLLRANGIGVDQVVGTLVAEDLTFEDNGQDRATEEQPVADPVWE